MLKEEFPGNPREGQTNGGSRRNPPQKSLTIKQYKAESTPGDLNAVVSGDYLLIPENIAAALDGAGVRTPEHLLSAMSGAAAHLAKLFGWSIEDIHKASVSLREQVKDHLVYDGTGKPPLDQEFGPLRIGPLRVDPPEL